MPTAIKYVFRGTTIGFKGGSNSQEHSIVCTSKHPAKALLFAMECANEHPDDAVIYIAKMERIGHLKIEGNVLKKKEEELAFSIAPDDFYKLTEGYIHFRDMQKLLKELDFDIYELVRIDKLTELCSRIKKISTKDLEILMISLEKFIKKV